MPLPSLLLAHANSASQEVTLPWWCRYHDAMMSSGYRSTDCVRTARIQCIALGLKNSRNGSGFKMDLKFGFLVKRNIYICGKLGLQLYFKVIFRRFSWLYYCACAETPLILLPVSKWISDLDFPCRKTYMRGKLGLKTVFCGRFLAFFTFFVTAHAQKHQ